MFTRTVQTNAPTNKPTNKRDSYIAPIYYVSGGIIKRKLDQRHLEVKFDAIIEFENVHVQHFFC